MSEMGKLERKFLKLYDTVGKNKNTTSKSDVKNVLTDVDRGSGKWYNENTHSGENLYDTPDDLKPQTEREWSAFSRMFATKTNGLKHNKSIVVFTADNVYYIEANGYMSGVIVEKTNLNNGATLKRSDFVDKTTRPISRMVKSYERDIRNSKRDLHSASNRRRARNTDTLDGESSHSRRTDDIDRGDEYSQEYEEPQIEDLYPGAVVYDGKNGYIVKEDKQGNKYFELIDEAELSDSAFSISEKQQAMEHNIFMT